MRDGETPAGAAQASETLSPEQDATGTGNRAHAGDQACAPRRAPGAGNADVMSGGEVSGDPIAILSGVLFLPSKLALSATASMVQLWLRMIAGMVDRRTGPLPGEPTGTVGAPRGGRQPVAGSAASAHATSSAHRSSADDDRHSLSSAHSLAHVLRCDGDYERARRLDENTLSRRRRVLGDDHPDTLSSAHNLAIDLSALGEHEAAGTLAEVASARRRRVPAALSRRTPHREARIRVRGCRSTDR
jgi:hypothetical protein